MAKCKVCGSEIPRGKRYKGERYKNISFCSEECYKKYVNGCSEKSESYTQLTGLLNEIYINPNWPFLTSQIKNICKEYNVTYGQIRQTIKYAVEIERIDVQSEYGLYQFIPRFLEPTKDFINKIVSNNKEIDLTDEESYVKINKKCNKRIIEKEIEF